MFPLISIITPTISLIIASYFLPRLLSKTSILHIAKKWWRLLEDSCHVYQSYKVPEFNQHMQPNQLYQKILTYLNSLPSLHNSDFANLFSGNNSTDINITLDSDQLVTDTFLGARVYWTNHMFIRNNNSDGGDKFLVLKIRRKDKRRILRPYIQHIHTVFDEIEQRRNEIRLYTNIERSPEINGRWISVPFTHPATIDSSVMDSDLKVKVKSDLELFLKSKHYYNRVGRVWKRSYLLYGPAGTGKSSFIAGICKCLNYDLYDVDLRRVVDDCDLKMLLLQTTNKSVIAIEDLDRYLAEEKSNRVSLSGILSFMDGVLSSCGEERVMVFTMTAKDGVDPTVMRPGRIDVHIEFGYCDFSAFKCLASTHLGIKDHKLFPQVEEIFQNGSCLSPAEIGEIMISNRGSTTRALKLVIGAMLTNVVDGRVVSKIPRSGSGRAFAEESGDHTGLFCRESVHTVREFRKLYGLLRIKSGRKNSMDFDSLEKHCSTLDN